MHDLAFARQHRLEFDRFAFADHALQGRQRQRLELIGFARTVAFGVDRIVAAVVAYARIEDVVEDQVERFERVAVAADQIRQARPANFEVLALGASDVDDRDVVDAHLPEQLFEQRARGLRRFRLFRCGGRRTRRSGPAIEAATAAAAGAPTAPTIAILTPSRPVIVIHL